ncbi:hypothetical protein D3C78_1535600 [compost metagenome]
MALSTKAIAAVRVPRSIRLSVLSRSTAKRRIDMLGPSMASGGMMALTREPSLSRASTSGEDSSIRLPKAETIRSMMLSRWASSRKHTSVLCSLPKRSTYTDLAPLIRMSDTVLSASSGSSGPRPSTSSVICLMISWRLATLIGAE